jgi:ribonuclease G
MSANPQTEILLNVGPHEWRGAVVDGGVLQEIHIERDSRRGLVGNLYKGRVTRVLPGMQAAFVDIGLERTAFLHADDIWRGAGSDAHDAAPVPDIRKLLSGGDEILVQVQKDPLGSKGARLSSYVSLPSRLLVFMPQGSGIGVSSRIEAETERLRLRSALAAIVADGHIGGYILRTAAIDATAEELAADLAYLEKLWTHVRQRAAQCSAGQLVHEDLPLSLRMLRDELTPRVERVLVDDAAEHARMLEFARRFSPQAEARIVLHTGPRPLFDLHGVEEDLRRALERKVPLPSGGHLVIDQTESMTTIDVNTGGFVGHRDLEDTIYRTNLEASVAIARQLRLRNIGGIIIIDFIDMTDTAHREQVLESLQRALAADRAQTQVAGLSSLGLVEMTRKRTRESLEHLLCQPCAACEGRGFVRTPETVCHEIFRELLRQAGQFSSRELLVLAHQDVIERLLGEAATALAELEPLVGRPIRLQSESLYDVDQFDVVLA